MDTDSNKYQAIKQVLQQHAEKVANEMSKLFSEDDLMELCEDNVIADIFQTTFENNIGD